MNYWQLLILQMIMLPLFRRLNNWANYRLEGGILSLPEDLRLK